jgi:hypothetical protein
VNYAQLIKKSIAYPEVVALCRQAGLSLNADLETLDNSPRISADPSAVRCIFRYVTLPGDLAKPQLNIHTIGDGLGPSPTNQPIPATIQPPTPGPEPAGRPGQSERDDIRALVPDRVNRIIITIFKIFIFL